MSSPTSAAVVPDDYSKPLASLDSNNRAAWIIVGTPRALLQYAITTDSQITVAFDIVVIATCLAIRIFVRLKSTSTLGYDDACFAGAFVFATLVSGMALGQVKMGFGETINNITQSRSESAQRYAYAAVLCFIFVIYSAKASVLVFYKRLSPQLFSRSVWIGLGAALMTCGIASIFLLALTCNLTEPWLQYTRECPTLAAQWTAFTALNIATEAALVGVAVYLVWGLQMPLARKIKVVCAFAARVPLIAVTSIHLQFTMEQIKSADPTFIGAIPLVIRQIEIGYALLSALIPCLRPFLTEFHTDFMAMGGNTIVHGASIGTLSGSRNKVTTRRTKDSYHLKSFNSQNKESAPSERMSGLVSTAIVSGKVANRQTGPDSDSITSQISQQQIIRKTTEWKVESDSARSM